MARLPFVDTHVLIATDDPPVEAFGTERSFVGRNWPDDQLYSSYGDVLDADSELISDLTEPEQRACFSENAHRIFRLDLPAAT